MWAKIITIKRTKDFNYFSLCALNLFNTQVSQFELNYWNKWTFPRHSNLLRSTYNIYTYVCVYIYLLIDFILWWTHLILYHLKKTGKKTSYQTNKPAIKATITLINRLNLAASPQNRAHRLTPDFPLGTFYSVYQCYLVAMLHLHV